MARSDLLLSLVRSASKGDQLLFRRTVEALIADERRKQHHVLAGQLAEMLRPNGSPEWRPRQPSEDRVAELVSELTPRRSLEDLVIPDDVRSAIAELVEEHHHADLLRSFGLEPRNRILLAGPPGNGKTSSAEAVAETLAVPLIVVRYDGVIGSFLGETALRLRRVFDFAATRQCILFFDEFDTVGKERGDVHETGEIKRVVSSLLLQVDSLPSHVIVITATNHPELLDRAVWRRFQVRLLLPAPTRKATQEWFERLQSKFGGSLGYAPRTLADKLVGLSFAELEEFGLALMRRKVLAPDEQIRHIVDIQLEHLKARFRPPDPEG